jgi:hypothetical protein
MASLLSRASALVTELLAKYRILVALISFVLHYIDLASDVVMCIMLHNAQKRNLFIASACSICLTLFFTIFYDATIHVYVHFFGDIVADTFRLNRNVMRKDLIGGFLSFFYGPLTPLLLPESYNPARLLNRVSIVSAISEDIPQAIIAMIILLTQDGWNSELAFVQVISSLVAGILKYFVGIFFESKRPSLSNPSPAGRDTPDGVVPPSDTLLTSL